MIIRSKADYRHYFALCKPYVKMAQILRELGEEKTNFSLFCKSDAYDHYMSIEKLEKIYQHTQKQLADLIT